MKASRIVLMLALVSFALMSYAGIDVDRRHADVKISIVQASHNPGLSQAIYQQVERSIFHSERTDLIIVRVSYKKLTVIVYGTSDQWRRFYTTDKIVKGKNLIDR